MPNITYKVALSIHEFCEKFNVSKSTCYNEIKAGKLPVRKLGRKTLIAVIDAEEWFDNLSKRRAVPPTSEAA